MQGTPPTSVVKISVRLGPDEDAHQRVISLRIPEGMDPMELLANGFAIDGNQAAASVAWEREAEPEHNFWGPFAAVGGTLTQALAESQRALVKYLREKGFEPQVA